MSGTTESLEGFARSELGGDWSHYGDFCFGMVPSAGLTLDQAHAIAELINAQFPAARDAEVPSATVGSHEPSTQMTLTIKSTVLEALQKDKSSCRTALRDNHDTIAKRILEMPKYSLRNTQLHGPASARGATNGIRPTIRYTDLCKPVSGSVWQEINGNGR